MNERTPTRGSAPGLPSRLAWAGFLGAGLAATSAFLVVPEPLPRALVYEAIAVASLLAIVAGTRLHRPTDRRPWVLLAGSVAASLVADVIWQASTMEQPVAVPFASTADPVYLLANGLLVAAGLALLRSRLPERIRAGLLDAAIIAVGISLLFWSLAVAPYLAGPGLGLGGLATVVGYAVVFSALLAVFARLGLTPGVAVPAYALLALALLGQLLAYGLYSTLETYRFGDLPDAGWLLFYLGRGAAALHPSMRWLGRPAEPSAAGRPLARFALMGIAVISPLAAVLVQLAVGVPLDPLTVVVGMTLLAVLVLWRAAILVEEVEAKAVEIRALNTDLEARVTARTRELADANRELAGAVERVERAGRAKSEFLTRMGAELREPLQSILGFSQLLELDPLTPDQRDGLRHVLSGGRRLLIISNEVLDVARIETGRLTLVLEPIDVEELLRAALDFVRPTASREGVELALEPPPQATAVVADRERLDQLLFSLLSFAVRQAAGGRVTLACEEASGDRVRLLVRHTGVGLEPQRLARLFEPFEHLGASEGVDAEGAGLGLMLSRRIAEAMGGTVGAESEIGRGSLLHVALPRAPTVAGTAERGGAAAKGLPEPAGSIVLIENDPAHLAVMARTLERYPGIRLFAAAAAAPGIELARARRPAAIFLDLRLPDLPGEVALRLLRDDPATSGIPVIVTGVLTGEEDHQRILAAGATAYLPKPFDAATLSAALAAALTPSAGVQ